MPNVKWDQLPPRKGPNSQWRLWQCTNSDQQVVVSKKVSKKRYGVESISYL